MMYSNYYFALPKTCRPRMANVKSETQTSFRPGMNVINKEKELQLEFSLVGVLKEDITLQIKDQVLTLEAKRLSNGDDKSFIIREFGPVLYKTNIRLPENADENSLKAEFQNGILKLTIEYITKPGIQIEIK